MASRTSLLRRFGRRLFRAFEGLPVLHRVFFHARRIQQELDIHFFKTMSRAALLMVFVSALAVTFLEPDKQSLGGFGESVYWSVMTIIGADEPSYVGTGGGRVVSWLLTFFGVAILSALTAAIVAFVIDFILKEGQGMGAAGYRDHIVLCGWNSTARELLDELKGDEFEHKVVLIHEAAKNPADGVYFVNGDPTSAKDLTRAGIEDASAAIIFPADNSNDADMRSILTVLAVETMAPEVRTVVEVNNPAHVEHFERAHADEILVTSRLASRLLARSALYPGLAELVTDVVSGGEGSELYRVELPDDYVALSVDDLSALLRRNHRATLLSVGRDGEAITNPPTDFVLQKGDSVVVVAESLGNLEPLETQDSLRRED